MTTEPWLKKIHEAPTPEAKAHLTATALDEYSKRISIACACPECDLPFVVAALHQYIDSFNECMDMPQRLFTKMLTEAARESIESVKIRIPLEKRP